MKQMSMRLAVMVLMLGGLGLVSCAGSGKAPAQQGERSLAAGSDRLSDGTVAPPPDAQWTIHCYVVTAVDHVAQARRLKDHLAKNTPLRDWYVVHGEQSSTLYHGYYRSINDPSDARESSRAQAERRQVEALRDAMGDPMFRNALFVPFESPDPDGPPEWNLLNAKGTWTLEIAVYRDSPERKQAAVEAVREARAMGVEAYYYHGTVGSSVCIGAWPLEAVRAQEADAARASDPNQPILVAPAGARIDPNLRDAQGRRVKVFQPRLDPVDPTLIAAMQTYTTYAMNGFESGQRVRDPRTGQERFVPDRPQLVEIPKREPSLLAGPTAAPGSQQVTAPTVQAAPVPPPQPRPPVRTAAPGAGRLRSIDD
jgi:hypothetical protein